MRMYFFSCLGRTPKGSYSPRGRSRHPEPSQNPSQNAVLPYGPLGVHPTYCWEDISVFDLQLYGPRISEEMGSLLIFQTPVVPHQTSTSPKPHPSKPHPCNMPQAKNGSCAAIFGKLRCRSCTATFASLQCGSHFYQKLRCSKRKNCSATVKKLRCSFLRISSSHV